MFHDLCSLADITQAHDGRAVVNEQYVWLLCQQLFLDQPWMDRQTEEAPLSAGLWSAELSATLCTATLRVYRWMDR